jgi:hypothetical protein
MEMISLNDVSIVTDIIRLLQGYDITLIKDVKTKLCKEVNE